MLNHDENVEWNSSQLQRAIKAAGVALWTWNVDTDAFVMDRRGYELWDVRIDGTLSFEDLSEKIHPADRDRVRAAFIATRAVVGLYEIDFRILCGLDIRWVSARGQGNDEDILARSMTGIFLDVTSRKQAEEGHELLAGEMSHRVKNLLAIATGLTQITSRSANSITDMTSQLTQRLTALGRAHDLVRPLPGGQGKAALLGDLITILLAPYDETAAFSGRIRVAVPRMGVGEGAATGLALVIHELATNSLKYGALSSATGTLDLSGKNAGEDVVLTWTEQGGPEVVAPEGEGGYGSRLLMRTMSAHLGGTIAYNWTLSGAQVTLTIDGNRLSV
ncbi:Two-component sensor histidine kinase, contains HisKA and HATPase domains [Rhizobium sp. NFR07]|uniref:sensor histidine kinase n=1 Tax=Rhizobium sp. NFR07 TaxID=1566262 RepID=UPI0008EB60D0|nr:sensor histidine kinase [Rhizobium sp. NFR07]SFB60569.1 Two-component sensor histidine kinase, contains HisKA and HATPase domains [Rhizobium sp. NFR07]SFB61987.1 Two-component sensor histidine kinase, contains HisKA and HATPase domains [Rhizobium sp. NFR07]SFB64784.1 Two-component sensor histidine kinase, contains HisKA and HATPase domains [Rhizobium sp. NFR07]